MNDTLLTPFCAALQDVLSTMAQLDVKLGEQGVKQGQCAQGDVSGVIALVCNKQQGSMAISFSGPLIIAIFERMLGEAHTEIDAEICDLAGEITNMVTGAAKPRLVELGFDLALTRPQTFSGNPHNILHSGSGTVMAQRIHSPLGDATLELCF